MPIPFRLSRLTAPRGTLAASLLIVLVFLIFGVCVEALTASSLHGETFHLPFLLPDFSSWLQSS